jgi:hypothetical protein
MSEFLGFTAVAVVIAVTLIWAHRYPRIAYPLIVGLAARLLVALYHYYVAPLPGGTADAVRFEQTAWDWAQGGLPGVLEQFRGPHSFFYSVLLGMLYALTDRSPLMGSAVGILASVGALVFTYRLACLFWSKRIAVKAVWVGALFPTLVLFSAFTRREAFIYLAVTAALYYAARWGMTDRLRHFVASALWFAVGVFFHTGLIMGIAGLMLVALWRYGRRAVAQAVLGRLGIVGLLVVGVVISGAVAYTTAGVALQGLGAIQQMIDVERTIAHAVRRARDDAAYPQWMLPRRPIDLTWNVPARTVYLLFAPFPWDVRRLAHLQGLADGILYMVLMAMIWKNRRAIMAHDGARTVVLVLLPMILVFAMGTGNFGNGLRHRAKFVLGLIALAAPSLRTVALYRREEAMADTGQTTTARLRPEPVSGS